MTIAPIHHQIDVKQPPARAFELFTGRIGDWWPKGRTPAENPHVDIVIEPHAGGRWFERDATGKETPWGQVLSWDPPGRVVLGWQLNGAFTYDPKVVTEVELNFQPLAAGGTRVTLEHRNLARFGADAQDFADRIKGGWGTQLGHFANFADAPEATQAAFVLHGVPGSPYVRSVQITLMEKGLPYRWAALNPGLLKGEAHLRRHPFGKIPVLDHDGFRLYETQAILRYLDRVQPAPSLTPGDIRQAARMDQIMNICDWYLFIGAASVIAFHRIVGPKLMGLQADEAAIAEAMPKAHTVVAELSRLLGTQSYLTGETLSLADIMIAPQLDFLAMTPEWTELKDGRANIDDWLTRMRARPSMIETTWEKVAAMPSIA